MNLFCIQEKKLLCPLCCFHNVHDKNHNVVGINDKKSLENYGISYKVSLSEFDGVFKKAKNLKKLIEDEIEKLNIFYKKEILR